MASPGDTIDQYRVQAELGEGGFGTVFRAVHTLTGQAVALKLLHTHHLGSPRVVERFLAEAQARQLRGEPHIVEILGAGRTAAGEAFIAMELLEGEPLDERLLREAPLRGDVALHIAVQLLEGLAAAHRKGVVHRDLKPANVFLVGAVGGDAPTVKILDFGVSKFTRQAGSPSLTKTGMILGTPLYMAPEQFLAVKSVDGRADLYSASVLFYTMLSGHMPFAAETYEELIVRISTTAPTPLGEVAPWLPAGLRHLIERGLSRDPDGRFRSAEEYIAGLRALATANTVEVLRVGRGTVPEHELAPPTPHPAPAASPVGATRAATPVVRSAAAYEPTMAAATPDDGSWAPGTSGPMRRTPGAAAVGLSARRDDVAVPPRAAYAAPARGGGARRSTGIARVAALGIGGAVVAGLAVVGILSIASAPDAEDPSGPPEMAMMPMESAGGGGGPPAIAPANAPDAPVAPPVQPGQPAAPGPVPAPEPPRGPSPAAVAGELRPEAPEPDRAPAGEAPVPEPAAPPAASGGGRARVSYRGLSQSFHAADGRALARQLRGALGQCSAASRTPVTVQVQYGASGGLMGANRFPPHGPSDATTDCVIDTVREHAADADVDGYGVFFLDIVLTP